MVKYRITGTFTIVKYADIEADTPEDVEDIFFNMDETELVEANYGDTVHMEEAEVLDG